MFSESSRQQSQFIERVLNRERDREAAALGIGDEAGRFSARRQVSNGTKALLTYHAEITVVNKRPPGKKKLKKLTEIGEHTGGANAHCQA